MFAISRWPTRVALLVLLVPTLAGCGGRATGDVSGKVLYQNKPLPGGYVTFISAGENSATVSSAVQPDGTYSVSGVPIGTVTVTVQGVRASTRPAGVKAAGTPPPSDGAAGKTVFVPPKYANTNQSGLTYAVVKGKQTHDIELK